MFWLLLLAHLLGDYPFQPDWLVRQKRHSWALLLHGGIHLMFMLVLVGPVRFQVIPQLLALTAAHIIVDATKTTISTKGSLSVQVSYLLDQGIHLLLMGLTTFWITSSNVIGAHPQNWGWAVIVSGFVFVSFAWGTTERLLTEGQTGYHREVVAQFYPRMITRAGLLALSLFVLQSQASLFAVGALPIPYLSGEYRGRAFLTDLGITALTALIAYWVLA